MEQQLTKRTPNYYSQKIFGSCTVVNRKNICMFTGSYYLLLVCVAILTSHSMAFKARANLQPETITIDSKEEQILTSPCVAYNTREGLFLAVWVYRYGTTDWDIDGRVLDSAGQSIGNPFGIAWIGTIVQQEPDVAYNPVANQFLVVYELSPGNRNVSGCLVAGDGTPGGFIHIADTSFSEVNPSVAFDPITNEYLVVYEREHMLDNVVWREVWAQRIAADVTLLDSPFMISAPGTHSLHCAIACAGSQFLVVWQEQQVNGQHQVKGRMVQCGSLGENTIDIGRENYNQESPRAAYNPARAEYLVVYQSRASSSDPWRIQGRPVNTIGQLGDSNDIAWSKEDHCKTPDVAYIPADDNYLVVWAQSLYDAPSPLVSHRIMARRVNKLGDELVDPEWVSGPGKDQSTSLGVPAPAVAHGTCGQSLVVWEDYSIDPNSSNNLYTILGAYGLWGSSCSDID